MNDRIINAIVKEKEEARADFEEAVDDGQSAYLGEQTRRDIFKISVGNIPLDGSLVTVELVYVIPLEIFVGEEGNGISFFYRLVLLLGISRLIPVRVELR